MDNTSSDNKNYKMFDFLALLVKLKIFEKIKICFLLVGHTHEDIDQLFSQWAEKIYRSGRSIWNLQSLVNLFMEEDTNLVPVEIQDVPDTVSWMRGNWQ